MRIVEYKIKEERKEFLLGRVESLLDYIKGDMHSYECMKTRYICIEFPHHYNVEEVVKEKIYHLLYERDFKFRSFIDEINEQLIIEIYLDY